MFPPGRSSFMTFSTPLLPCLRSMLAAAFLCAAALGAASADRPLLIGRADTDSLVSDIAEQVVRTAFQRAGIALEIRRYPLVRSITMASDGEIDGDVLRMGAIVDRFPGLVEVPTPVMRLDLAIYGMSPALATLTRDQIRHLRVGITRGIYTTLKHSRGMATVETDATIPSGFAMLTHGRFDVFMVPYIDAEAELARHPLAGVRRWPWLWATEPQYLVLNRRHAVLVGRLNDALLQMQHEGLIENAYQVGLRRYALEPLTVGDRPAR
jgi:polar amino acid transport system substrate-binding protein